MLVYQRVTSYHLQRPCFFLLDKLEAIWMKCVQSNLTQETMDSGHINYQTGKHCKHNKIIVYILYNCTWYTCVYIYTIIYIYMDVWFYIYIYIYIYIIIYTSENIHVQVHPCKMSQLLTVHPKRRSSTLSERSPASVWGIPPGTLQWTNLAVSELKVWWDRPWTMLNWYWVISCVIIRCVQKKGEVWRSMEKWGPYYLN